MHRTTTRRARTLTRATTSVCRALIEALEDRRLMSFSAAVNYPSGTPQDVVRGDFNGDTRPDLAVTNYSAGTVSVLLGNANGTFQAPLTSPTGVWPLSAAVGDFNGDGKLDLATSNAWDLNVLLGNGNGTFQAPTPLSVEPGATPAGVAVGDFNADGKLDLAAASNVYYPGWGYYYGYPGHYSGRFNLLLGTGTGSFAAATTTPLGNSNMVNSVAAADFNGDGKLDVATADNGYWWGGAHPIVAFGNGTGGLGTVTHLNPSSNGSPQSVAAGDLNGDGKADLIGVNSYENTVDVLLANGTGGFAAPQPYAAGASSSSAELGDFNGDAKVDLMTANTGDGSVSVLLGAGTGVFHPPAHFAVGTQPVSVAVGDFNGDGRTDAASANNGSANVSVLLNDGNWPSSAPFITINDVTVTEGHGGTVNATLTVSLSAASAQTVTVKYATTDGSATAGDDYNAVAPTLLTFAPGEVSKQITVQVKGDRVAESTETFGVVLSEPTTNAFLGDTTGTVSITDDEPRITIDDVTAAEGNSGTKTFTFTLHLSAASDAAVSVNYSTFEGDTDYWPYNQYSYYYGPPAATAGSDFVAKTGTATFSAGQTSTTVTVVVNGDRVAEPDEAFSLDLSDASGALIDDYHAVGTITNDEPYVSVSGGSVTEGNSGTQLLPFTITLSQASDVAVTVNYATADGSATAGTDYVARSGSVTFAAGETSKTVNVTVNGDRLAEGDEYFHLLLGTVTNAGVGTGQALGSITDNEPTISINNVSTTEGNSGSKLLTFTVTLSAAYDQTVTVGYATQNGSAKSGKDYGATSGTLTFLAGQTTKTFTVSIKGDKQREPDEWFNVVLRNPSVNALIGDGIGEGLILNDDFR